MNNTEFLKQLNEYIASVYDHEQDFIIEFLREFVGCEIDLFYMESELCFVELIDMESGATYKATIDTDKFILWFDGLKYESNTCARLGEDVGENESAGEIKK